MNLFLRDITISCSKLYTSCTVIPAGDLIAGKRDVRNADIIAAYSSWGAVHGSGTTYTRMALYMLDNLFRATFSEPAPPPNKGKRPRSESTSSSGGHSTHSGSSESSRNSRTPKSRGDKRESAQAATATNGDSPAAVPEAASAAATEAAPRGATTTHVVAATPASDLRLHVSVFFLVLYRKKM
jgi:hypothetical protein